MYANYFWTWDRIWSTHHTVQCWNYHTVLLQSRNVLFIRYIEHYKKNHIIFMKKRYYPIIKTKPVFVRRKVQAAFQQRSLFVSSSMGPFDLSVFKWILNSGIKRYSTCIQKITSVQKRNHKPTNDNTIPPKDMDVIGLEYNGKPCKTFQMECDSSYCIFTLLNGWLRNACTHVHVHLLTRLFI